MKTLFSVLLVFVLLSLSGFIALAGQKSVKSMHANPPETAKASASQYADVRENNACPHCGMDREKFSHARMLITYSNGLSAGVCSIRCAVIELKTSKDKIVTSVEVADYLTGKLIPADKAFWVIGGRKKGVMTATPKWAFARQDDAKTFIQTNGGTLTTYKEALARAEKD